MLEGRRLPATFTVVNTADGGAGSLRDAIEQANADPAPDTIDFDPAVTGTITLSGALPDLSTALVLAGPGASALTVARAPAEGTPEFRIFTVTAGAEVTISGLSLTGGRASGGVFTPRRGGGIFNAGTLTVSAVTLSDNLARFAGAFSSEASGGGIYNAGTLTVTDSAFIGNRAIGSTIGGGGGIYNAGLLTVTGSTFNDNQADLTGRGAGLFNEGTSTVTASTFSGNMAAQGGGIYNRGTLTVTNSTLSRNGSPFSNSSGSRGIENAGLLTVTHSTLSGNAASTGAITGSSEILNISQPSDPSVMGRLTIAASIFAGGMGGTVGGGEVTSLGRNLFNDRPAFTLDPTDLVATDPLLGPLADHGGPTSTHALLPGSPAIDAGGSLADVTADQRGVPRPQGSAPDIGAFESRGFTLAVAGGDNQGAPRGSPFPGPLAVTVASPVGEPVQGGRVTFAAPTAGASAALAGNPATIGPDGRAMVTATANGSIGTYPVTAQAAGAPGIGFSLTNLPIADLSVLAVASPDPAVAGTPLSYTITVANGGPDTAPAVALRAALPAGVELVSTSQGGLDPATGAVVADLGDLAAGTAATVTIVVRPTAAGTITNSVAATTGAVDPDPLNNQAVLTTRVRGVADLSIRQAAAPLPAAAGLPLTYTITVTNTGPDTATDVTLRDALPAGVAFVSASQGTLDPTTGAVLASLGDLAAGASATVTIVVRPAAAGTITNTVTAAVGAASVDPDPENNTATLTETVVPAADLAVAQAATPDPTTATQPTTFALTVTNHGPSPATGVVVTDTLPVGAAFVSADGGVTPVEGTLSFALGTLDVGEVRTVRFVVRPARGGTTTNVVRVRSDVLDPVAANDVDARDTPAAPAADLAVAQAATPDPAVVGQDLSYTVTVGNDGPDPAAGVVLVNTLPVGAVFVSAVVADTGEVAPVGPELTFHLGTLAAGQRRTIVITVRPAGTGLLFNRAGVGGATFDPDASDNSSSLRTPVTAAPEVPAAPAAPTVVGLQRLGGRRAARLVLTFSAPLDPAPAGRRGNYRLTAPGRDQVFGTRDDRAIRLRAAAIGPDARTVTLTPRPRLPLLGRRYQLIVAGTPPGGLTGQDGIALDGDGDGRPGGVFVTTFGAAPFAASAPRRTPGTRLQESLAGPPDFRG